MRLAAALLTLLLAAAALAGVDEELAQAAKSPYDIARFVDRHASFQWEPLWQALGIKDADLATQPCEAREGAVRICSEELITIPDPSQVVLILRQEAFRWQVYLRFLRERGPDGWERWKFAGYYQPMVKDYPPKYRTIRFGKKPYLLLTSQGASGSDWSSELELWLDLTAAEFEPVFSLTIEGHYSGAPYGVGRDTHATVVGLESEPVERIRVAYSVRFKRFDVPLGEQSDDAVYTRRGGKFVFDAALSKRSAKDIGLLYDIDTESGPSNEDSIRNVLPALKKIAAGPDTGDKDWLRGLLAQCKNTPEKRALAAILQNSPSKPKRP